MIDLTSTCVSLHTSLLRPGEIRDVTVSTKQICSGERERSETRGFQVTTNPENKRQHREKHRQTQLSFSLLFFSLSVFFVALIRHFLPTVIHIFPTLSLFLSFFLSPVMNKTTKQIMPCQISCNQIITLI